MKVHDRHDIDALGLNAIQKTVGKLWDETQRFSPKPGARLLDDLRGRNPNHLSGFQFAQPALGLLEPELLSIGVPLLIKADDQTLRETCPVPARELQGLAFEVACWVSHTEKLSWCE